MKTNRLLTVCSITEEMSNVILIKHANTNQIVSNEDEINRPQYWNGLRIVGGAKWEKSKALDEILMAMYPHVIIPVMYQVNGEDTFFIFRGGSKAVLALCQKNFVLKDDEKNIVSPLYLMINYVSVEEESFTPVKSLENVVNRRVNSAEQAIDFRNFKNDPDCANFYVSLNIPQFAMTIGTLLRKKIRAVRSLLLSHNELENLDFLETFKRNGLLMINYIDLSYNKLSWSAFEKISKYSFESISIKGNPLCDDFAQGSPFEMVREVKKLLPNFKTLDSVEIDKVVLNDVVAFKTFFINASYATLVDHFLHHYFMIFQSNRELLPKLYHADASFSFSIFDQPNSVSSIRNSSYMKYQRNLLTMSDLTKAHSSIAIGRDNVAAVLKTFPEMQLDYYSCKVDVPIAKIDSIVIDVTGIFKDTSSLPELFSFTRTFIICPLNNNSGQWKIVNDMWCIAKASIRMSEGCFMLEKAPVKSDFGIMLHARSRNKETMIEAMCNLTNMKRAWVEKFLGESMWDLEMALQAFIDQYKSNQILAEAFVVEKQ